MPGKKVRASNLLTVPSPETDDKLVNLADWVEIKALLESDGSASLEDLVRAMRRAYSMPRDDAQALAGDVFKELRDRGAACASLGHKRPGYPYSLNESGNLLSARTKPNANSHAGILYTFLLVASRAEMDARRQLQGLDPTIIFERLCAEALLNFWGGRSELSGSLVFGAALKKGARRQPFSDSIDSLCEAIRHGRGMKRGAKTPGVGDGKLDVVVWRVFSDGREGGLIGFGQCKTGIHWKSHLTELQPRNFCAKYFRQPLILDPIRVYMVPHRVDGSEWESHSGEGGLILDRCRLVQYGNDISKEVLDDCRAWLNAALDRQRKGKFAI